MDRINPVHTTPSNLGSISILSIHLRQGLLSVSFFPLTDVAAILIERCWSWVEMERHGMKTKFLNKAVKSKEEKGKDRSGIKAICLNENS
jgi:hypothetical protein